MLRPLLQAGLWELFLKVIVKSGSDQLTSSHVADDRTLIVNLRERWPVKVLFSKKLNELLINVRHDSEPIRIRMSHPIEVTNKEICKDQVLIVYKKRELILQGAPAQKTPIQPTLNQSIQRITQ